MSRVGKKPILVPAGVTVTLKEHTVSVKGPKGELTRDFGALGVKIVNQDGKELHIERGHADFAAWGLARALLASMVTGTEKGFTKILDVRGVGYRAAVSGKKLTLELGFSHPVEVAIPDGIEAKVQKSLLVLSGANAEQLGNFAASIRSLRPPEPYKGKGIRYQDEHVRQKEGKKAATEGAGGGA